MSAFKNVICINCQRTVRRKVRHTNDVAKFCSRVCSYSFATYHAVRKPLVKTEIKALRLISKRIRSQKKCKSCSAILLRKFVQLCRLCRSDKVQIYRKKYRKSDSFKISKRKHRSIRRARIRCSDGAEVFDPFEVFDRDKWQCKICSVQTPKSKRGSLDDDAPELDHIIPLSKGGAHTRANTQCLCRKCNHIKSDNV